MPSGTRDVGRLERRPPTRTRRLPPWVHCVASLSLRQQSKPQNRYGEGVLTIRLLGAPDITVDGQPLVVDTRKALAVLAYLTAEGSPQPRDRLVDLLWPEIDPDRGRGALRRTLSVLRSALRGGELTADRSKVSLSSAWSDLDRLGALEKRLHDHSHPDQADCPRCQSDLEEAIGLRRGDFLDGFLLKDAPEFEEWTTIVAEVQRRRFVELLHRLAEDHVAAGRYREAIAVIRQHLLLDPLDEAAYRRRMLVSAWSGDRSTAVAAYRECVRMLQRELGVEPLLETTELYEAILEEDLPRPPSPPQKSPHVSVPLSRAPLVGRDEAIRRVVAGFETIRRSGLLFGIEGEPGIGKSRLLEELGLELSRSGATVMTARAYRGEEQLPYAAVAEALAEIVERAETRQKLEALGSNVLAELSRLVPRLGRPPAPDEDPAARTRFLEAVVSALGALGDRTVLIVDDAQWLDQASSELLAYVARRLRTLPLLLLVAFRPEEAPEQLRRVIQDHHSIRLERLTRDEVASLTPTGLDADGIHARSGGLPLFVVEYVAAWQAGSVELPAGVKRLLVERLQSLSEVARQLSSSLAVIGHSAPLAVLIKVSGRTELETAQAIDELVARRVLVEEPGGIFDFLHDELRDLGLAEVGVGRRMALHRRAAAALMGRRQWPGRSEGWMLREPGRLALIAGHLRESGDRGAAALAYAHAAEAASRVFALQEAVDHLHMAIDLGHPDLGRLELELADLLIRLGRYGDALTALAAGASFGQPIWEVEMRLADVHARLGDWDKADRHLELAGEPDAPAHRADLVGRRAYVAYRRGTTAKAGALANQALELANQAGERDAEARAHNLLGLIGDDAEHLRLAIAKTTDETMRVAALNNLARSLAGSGLVAEAIAYAEEALALAGRLGDRHREAAIHNNLADLLHAAGRDDESMEHLQQAVVIFSEVGSAPGALEPEVWKLAAW